MEQATTSAKDLKETNERLHTTNKVRHETEVKLGEEVEAKKQAENELKFKTEELSRKQAEYEELEK